MDPKPVTSNAKHFDNEQAAAALKHALLANYLTPFAVMTSGASEGNRVWFIDAYAGPGRYERQPGEVEGKPGSPLIALGIGKRIATIAKTPRHLNCIFIEREPAYANLLKGIVVAGNFPADTVVETGDAADHLASSVARAGKDPLLTFLDPFGTALPRKLMMDTLFARDSTATNEVLLNFHLLSVARIGSLLGQPGELSQQDQKTVARLDAFIGHDPWRAAFLEHYEPTKEGSATLGALAVASLFRDQVKAESGYDSFAIDIRKAAGYLPIFQLTLFYRHTAAEYKFADAASLANQKWRRSLLEAELREDAEKHSDALFAADFSEEQFEERWKADEKALSGMWGSDIEANILQLLKSRSSFRIREHVRALYGKHLGLAGEKHLRAAWAALEARHIVQKRPANLYYGEITRTSN